MRHHNRGYSLIELMVAITLGLVLLAGVIQVFVNSKQGYQVQQSAGRFQENSRFVVEYLSRNVMLADLWSGVKPANVSIAGGGTPSLTGVGACKDAWVVNQEGVHGYAGGAALSNLADPPQTCIATVSGTSYVPNSDVLVVRYVNPETFAATGSAASSSSGGSSGSSGSPASGLYASVTSASSGYWVRTQVGRKAEIFNSSTLATAVTDIPGDYSDGVLNYPFQASMFYLQTADNGEGVVPTLYMLSTQGNSFVEQPLIDGIEMLKFEYGIDSNNDQSVDQYMPACAGSGTPITPCVSSTNWSQVISVRVSMIVRGDTLDNFQDTQVYQVTKSFCYAPQSATVPSSCTTTATYDTTTAKYQRRLVIREMQLRNRVRA